MIQLLLLLFLLFFTFRSSGPKYCRCSSSSLSRSKPVASARESYISPTPSGSRLSTRGRFRLCGSQFSRNRHTRDRGTKVKLNASIYMAHIWAIYCPKIRGSFPGFWLQVAPSRFTSL
ncbi:hypothetical protein C8F04DRAFT_427520 [Mycena alexandri]|uniref:Secreted protein n=1 Tax=Mycena alexandri TaxID=1745969 RepID=A0AAD6X2Z4_9AGAR|nr:hypothetical protein C8F04DRAFT_427520 [Mycena alexandri]